MLRGAAATLGAIGLSLGMWAPAAAASGSKPPVPVAPAGAQPAFCTYQDPGGATTAGRRVIALTFDDGPGPYTPQVLSVLERFGVPATFFEIGEHVAQYPQYARMLAAAGYPVEDHTWTHPALNKIATSQFPYQIDQTQTEIRSVTGRTPMCVRPPYNSWNATVLDQVARRGLTTMSYSVGPKDWTLPGAAVIRSRVIAGAFPGAVVDLHDAGGPRDQTVAALPGIITALESQGYRFVSICGSAAQPTRWQSAVYPFGDSAAPAATAPVASDRSIVGASADPTGGGYWLVAADGGVFSFGDARFFGSAGGAHLDQPVVGMAADSTTGGYWLVAADGGVFSFHAPFRGSAPGRGAGERFYAIAATGAGSGYLLAGESPHP